MLEDTIVEEDIHPTYESAGASDVGRLRNSNQDAVLDCAPAGLWVIADGMGGYRDGDVASGMVCDALRDSPAEGPLEELVDVVRERMSGVNQQLYDASIRPIDPIVSGSTVVALAVRRTACAVLWAGDSRAYRLRDGRLTQLTTDHTRAAELEMQGLVATTEEDHAITRAVGGEDTLLLEVRRERVRLNDRYLLCSDGLTRELDESRLTALLADGDPRECARALIAAALAAGGRDNVSVLVIDAV